MISRRRVPGLLALALCVIGVSAVMASSAFAATPVFKSGSGKFPVYNTDKSGLSELKTANHATIECTASTSTGQITSTTTVAKVVVAYTGCSQKKGEIGCKSGTVAGEIVTKNLKGTLTGTEAEPTEKLEPESGTEFVKIKCGTVNVLVTGTVTGKILRVKKLEHTGTLTFSNAGGLIAFEEAATLTSKDELAFFKNEAHTESETLEVS